MTFGQDYPWKFSSANTSTAPTEVILPFYTASTPRRFVAFVLDHLIYQIFYYPVYVQGWTSYVRTGFTEIEWRTLILCFVLQFFFRVSFFRFLGATPGKLFLGFRVVNCHSGGELTWGQAVIRVFTEHLSFFFGVSFLFLAFLRLDRTHLADWLAETRVVQFEPRPRAPRRRYFLGVFVFVYLFFAGFKATYKEFKDIELNSKTILFNK